LAIISFHKLPLHTATLWFVCRLPIEHQVV
jgi:hypothetical protein